MRSTILLGLMAAAAVAGASPALATASVNFNGGVGGLQPGESLYANFESGSTGNPTGSGFQTQNVSDGNGARPAFGSTGYFFSVLGGGSALFSFANPLSSLGFDYGSADDYNNFTLTFADATTQSINGNGIITTPPADGNQGIARTNGRVTFTTGSGPAITSLQITSRQNSAEIDNIGVIRAVPEPATWAMMLIGFGAVGFSMRRRPRSVLQAA